MGYIWLQETGDGFGADVDYVLTGSAARVSAELIRYRNQQSVHMREDRIVADPFRPRGSRGQRPQREDPR